MLAFLDLELEGRRGTERLERGRQTKRAGGHARRFADADQSQALAKLVLCLLLFSLLRFALSGIHFIMFIEAVLVLVGIDISQ